MTTLPEALRLAEYLRFPAHCPNEYVRDRQAADELIRLYEENEKLREAAQQALEALEKYRKMMFVEAGCRFGEGDAAITALRGRLEGKK